MSNIGLTENQVASKGTLEMKLDSRSNVSRSVVKV